MCPEDSPRFIVDLNVGRLARWLRMIGYDTELFDHRDDKYLIHMALTENRIVLTRDTQIMQRRIVAVGEIKALLVTSDNPLQQIQQVIKAFGLNPGLNPFKLCLECNQTLEPVSKEDIKDRVPPYVYATKSQYESAEKGLFKE
ncbi:MAG: Mut7-C RNAse domain-containing protein [Dehalococcoidales bacterium]